MPRYEIGELASLNGTLRFVRVDDSIFAEPYSIPIPQESKVHSDLLPDSILEEIRDARWVQKTRFDAGMLSIQGGHYMFFSGSSNDLRLPVSPDARYLTSRKVQQVLGKTWRARAVVASVYELRGGLWIPRNNEDSGGFHDNVTKFRPRQQK